MSFPHLEKNNDQRDIEPDSRTRTGVGRSAGLVFGRRPKSNHRMPIWEKGQQSGSPMRCCIDSVLMATHEVEVGAPTSQVQQAPFPNSSCAAPYAPGPGMLPSAREAISRRSSHSHFLQRCERIPEIPDAARPHRARRFLRPLTGVASRLSQRPSAELQPHPQHSSLRRGGTPG